MRNQGLNKCLATCHFLNSYKTKGNLLITQSFLSLLETAAVTGSIFALVINDGILKIEALKCFKSLF